jgi:hypothetical protein
MEPLVRAEADLSIEIGMPAEYLTAAQVKADLPDSIDPKGAVLFRDQAAFNPITYCVNLTVRQKDKSSPAAKTVATWTVQRCSPLSLRLTSVICCVCRFLLRSLTSPSFPAARCSSRRA